VQFEETLSVNRKDGVDVDVMFIHSPDEDSINDPAELAIDLSTVDGAVAMQGLFDKEAGKLDAETKKKLEALNKGSEFGKVNPIDAVTGAFNQIELAGNKFGASVGDIAFKMEKLERSVGFIKDPKRQVFRTSARRLELAARNLALVPFTGSGSKSKRVRTTVVQTDIGKLALAGNLGLSLDDLLKLNPLIARQTVVKQGTQVFYYSS